MERTETIEAFAAALDQGNMAAAREVVVDPLATLHAYNRKLNCVECVTKLSGMENPIAEFYQTASGDQWHIRAVRRRHRRARQACAFGLRRCAAPARACVEIELSIEQE